MDRYYYEYRITPSAFMEEIESFLMDRFYNGIEERDGTLILRSEEPLEDIIEALKEYVSSLQELFDRPIELTIAKEKKENADWIERYKQSVTPVELEEFYIHPSWYPPKNEKIDITIDPALAFGSGHHESTRGCLKAISDYVKPGMKLLDVGCGSGILAIAAAKKGAVVDICDTDELAIKESEKNFERNGVAYRKAWIGSANKAKEKYDIVIANIVADILTMISSDLKKTLKNGSILVLSGIIEPYVDKVAKKFADLHLEQMIADGEWRTMIYKKEANG